MGWDDGVYEGKWLDTVNYSGDRFAVRRGGSGVGMLTSSDFT